MCLSAISWQGDPLYYNQDRPQQAGKDPLCIWRGWKIFFKDPYLPSRYKGMFYGGLYSTNHWYLAKTTHRISAGNLVHEEDYSLGFHAYVNEGDANRVWNGGLDKSRSIVFPVQLMGVKVGGDDFYNPCIVADWMLIEEGE